VIVSSAATRYCFPPVLMTANIVCSVFESGSDAKDRAGRLFAVDRNGGLDANAPGRTQIAAKPPRLLAFL
jgi:hypothetical protein